MTTFIILTLMVTFAVALIRVGSVARIIGIVIVLLALLYIMQTCI